MNMYIIEFSPSGCYRIRERMKGAFHTSWRLVSQHGNVHSCAGMFSREALLKNDDEVQLLAVKLIQTVRPTMQLNEIYQSDQYKSIANQVENHMIAIHSLLKELDIVFPPKNDRKWIIMGDNRPYQRTLETI